MKVSPSRALFFATFAFAFAVTASKAETPLGGLTVAVTGDGKKLVAAGDTRTLLILDPEKLNVLQRIFIGTPVTRLAFDRTGATLIVGDTDGTAFLYDTQTWKPRATLAKRNAAVISREANLLAGAEGGHTAGAIVLNDLASGAEKTKIPVSKDEKVAAFGFDPQGKRLAVLFGPIESKDEQRIQSGHIPKELKGLERDEFQQKNDGQISILRIFNATTGAVLSEQKLFFSMNATQAHVAFDGDALVVNNYSNLGARIEPDGAVRLFKNANGFNYGAGASPQQTALYGGGLRSFSIVDSKSLQGPTGQIDRLPGWPEYFKGFAATDNGTAIYAGTTAYRVIRISPDGKVVAAAPVM
jgi:hypothetical protein